MIFNISLFYYVLINQQIEIIRPRESTPCSTPGCYSWQIAFPMLLSISQNNLYKRNASTTLELITDYMPGY